jgi:capsule polysaccharide export protein KpsE/RkpR
MAQEYVDELNRVVIDVNTSSAHRERVFLEERLAEVKQDLESAEKNFSEFASKNTALDIPAQGRAMIEAAAGLEGQLIATQTELGSLKQLYTDKNVRVRTMQARADELQRQLQKMGGKFDASASPAGQDDQAMYPSIRKLPLLGVSYADLYRNTRIEEAIYGSLTQQYELAKVQEAKETPSVKVLDPPVVPEKSSFPPRLLVVVTGAILAFSVGVTWVFGSASWESTEPDDPRKVFALEVMGSVRARLPTVSRNGSNGHNGSARPGEGC